MRIHRISLIMVAVVLAASVALAATVNVPGTGITINTPRGWTADTSPQGGALFILYSQPLQDFKSMISLSRDPLGAKSPDAWLAEYKAGLAQKIGDFKLIKEGEKMLGGAPYNVIEFRGMQGDVMLHWMQAIHIQEGDAWIFSGVTRERHAGIYVKQFQGAYSSIYFPPPPPENVAAEALSETEVLLTWSEHPLAEGGYEIQRRDAQMGAWQTIATAPAGSTSHNDTTILCDTEVRYRVKCLNPQGDSNWSKEAAATLGACPVLIEDESETKD